MTTTPHLGITVVETTDHVVGTSVADGLMFKVNDGFDRVDDNIGAIVCTSSTRPSSPYPQQIIYETDTRFIQIRNAANSAWVAVNTGIPVYANTGAVSAPFTNQIIFDTSFGGLKQYTGSIWVIYDANTKWLFKASNTSRTSTTTLTADTTFDFPMLANSAYAIEGYIPYTALAGSSSGGIQSDFTLPSGASLLWTNFGTPLNDNNLTQYNVVAQGLGAARHSAGNAATVMSMQPKGVAVIAGTAGSCTWRWAQSISSATATVVLGGAWMKVTRIS